MKKAMHWLVGGLLVAGYVMAMPHGQQTSEPAFRAESVPAHDEIDGEWQMRFASDADTPLVHAPAMVELPDGRLRAFWFAGEREGGPDVGIHTSVFDPRDGSWSDERRVVDRKGLREQWGRHIRKLGNAVPAIDDDGRMRLFVVAVSFGGWAASRLVVLESDDLGENWHFDESLVTSPFLNISTLVKTPPIRYRDGSLGLPVYHELVGKFGEVVRLDQDNRIIDKERIGHGRKAIQPLVLVDDEQHATAFLRNEHDENPGMLYRSDSQDGGESWSQLRSSGLANPSAAVGGVTLAPGHWILVANCNIYERDDLCIQETRDGGDNWRTLTFLHNRERWRGDEVAEARYLEMIDEEVAQTLGAEHPELIRERVEHNKCYEAGCEFQYDYPYVIQTRNGDVHILYTWNKSAIRHAWLPAEKALGATAGLGDNNG